VYKEWDWFSNNKVDFVFCCDANFGILKRDVEIAEYMSKVKMQNGYPQGVCIQNTKNSANISYKIQRILQDAGLNKGVTLSMQSLDQDTLKNIKRSNISLNVFKDLQERFTKDKIETYSDLILGLPGETYSSFINGVDNLIQNGQHNRIQFNNLSILPNAGMGSIEYQEKYEMVIVESDMVNIHGKLNDVENEILEKQQLVVGTHSMPKQDWCKTRSFCWMAGLLYFDKILQIPIIIIHKLTGIDYKDIIEWFLQDDLNDYPILNEIKNFFTEKAIDIQKGGYEYCYSQEWLDIFWPADEFILIKIITGGKIDLFYRESLELIKNKIGKEYSNIYLILDDSIKLNKGILKLPFCSVDFSFKTPYNIWEFYHGIMQGNEIPIIEGNYEYNFDRTSCVWKDYESYFREVIWYGNKKGAYLHSNNLIESQIAGIY